MYENCWLNLPVETERRFKMPVSSLKMKKWQHCQACHFTGGKCVGGKKRKCPIQKSNLGWTSPVWSICCSLGQTTQDWSGDTSEHCIPLGTRSCRRTASQIHLLPETKGLDDKKLHTVLTCPVVDHVKWSKTIHLNDVCFLIPHLLFCLAPLWSTLWYMKGIQTTPAVIWWADGDQTCQNLPMLSRSWVLILKTCRLQFWALLAIEVHNDCHCEPREPDKKIRSCYKIIVVASGSLLLFILCLRECRCK